MARSSAWLALALAVVAAVGAAAQKDRARVFGDRVRHPKVAKEYVRTYVDLPRDHDSGSPPLAVGVEITNGFNTRAQQLPGQRTMMIPTGPDTFFNFTTVEFSSNFPMVGRNAFNFLYWGFNANGHPDVGIYDAPHYDFHFMFPTQASWWAEYSMDKMGPCYGANADIFYKASKPVPAACWPGPAAGRYADSGNFVWAMGNHLIDFSGPEFNPPQTFNASLVFGKHDGAIVYYEAMITQELMARDSFNQCWDLNDVTPRYFNTERMVPTELCLFKTKGFFRVEWSKFMTVPAGCLELRTGPQVGYWPPGPPLPPGCAVAPAPATPSPAGH